MCEVTIRIIINEKGLYVLGIPGPIDTARPAELKIATLLQQVLDAWMAALQKGQPHSVFLSADERGGIVQEIVDAGMKTTTPNPPTRPCN